MSTNAEKLLALQEKVERFKEFQDIQILLESMGFFALREFIEIYTQTKFQLEKTKTSYSGGLISILKELIIATKSRATHNSNIRSSFTPA